MSAGIHIAGQIRAAAAAAVRSISGVQVFEARAWPLQDSDLPCVLVHTNSESVETQTVGRPRRQMRDVELVVVGVVRHSDNVESEMDALRAQIEEQIFGDADLRAVVRELTLLSADTAVAVEAAFVFGQVRLVFSATVYTREGAPTERI